MARSCPTVALTAAMAAACALLAWLGRGYLTSVSANGDNGIYAFIAEAIRAGRLAEMGTVKLFWGLPYAVALAGLLLHLDTYPAIAIISVLSTLATAGLASVLWSRRVAALFVVTNYTSLQFGVFGGAESLFMALVFSSFLLARRGYWGWAAVAAAAATTVRPLGCFALLAYVGCLVHQRRYKSALTVTACGLVVFILYGLPLYSQLGDAFANLHGYQAADWNHGWPIGLPFVAIVENFRNRQHIAGSAMLASKSAYVAAHVLLLTGALVIRKRRMRIFQRPQEGWFVCLYSVFLILYNAPDWALSIYPRLLLPISPMLLDAYRSKLPKNRGLLLALGLLTIFFAWGANLRFNPGLMLSGFTKLLSP